MSDACCFRSVIASFLWEALFYLGRTIQRSYHLTRSSNCSGTLIVKFFGITLESLQMNKSHYKHNAGWLIILLLFGLSLGLVRGNAIWQIFQIKITLRILFGNYDLSAVRTIFHFSLLASFVNVFHNLWY